MIRNIGILAHVDAGKTTVTEQMLLTCGGIRTYGRVDHGTAHTDTMPIERERGISVRAQPAQLQWYDTSIHIIDTPGHTDFAAEVERALRALDGVILVLSAVEGVQAHTRTLFQAIHTRNIPAVFFINKIDRAGADVEATLEDIHRFLTPRAALLQQCGEDLQVSGWPERFCDNQIPALIECLAEHDDAMLEAFAEEKIPDHEQLTRAITESCRKGEFYPVLCGAALKGIGVSALLDAVCAFLPPPAHSDDDPFAAYCFKVERTRDWGRLSYIRVHSGHVMARGMLNDTKIRVLKRIEGAELREADMLHCGEVGAIGYPCRIGEAIGEISLVPPGEMLAQTTMEAKILPEHPQDMSKLVAAMRELEDEDPHLRVHWQPEIHELSVALMGTVQREIITSLLKSRFGLNAELQPPSVIYKETAIGVGESAIEQYTPCYGGLTVRVSPLPRGSGLVLRNELSMDLISFKYRREIEGSVPVTLAQGLLGWEVTDLLVEVVDGWDDKLGTSSSDFRIFAAVVTMEALQNAGTTLLEPLLECHISMPEGNVSRVLADLAMMRATDITVESAAQGAQIHAMVPVATSMDYAQTIRALTGGKGQYATRFAQYAPCPLHLGVSRPRTGPEPLRRDDYIAEMVIGFRNR